MALSFMSGNSSTPILQRSPRGDRPDYDGPLELFPQNFHEPYYASYLEEDFGTIAKDCGLVHTRCEILCGQGNGVR
jgi:hypothetical protein